MSLVNPNQLSSLRLRLVDLREEGKGEGTLPLIFSLLLFGQSEKDGRLMMEEELTLLFTEERLKDGTCVKPGCTIFPPVHHALHVRHRSSSYPSSHVSLPHSVYEPRNCLVLSSFPC